MWLKRRQNKNNMKEKGDERKGKQMNEKRKRKERREIE